MKISLSPFNIIGSALLLVMLLPVTSRVAAESEAVSTATDSPATDSALWPSTLVYSASYNGMRLKMTRDLSFDEPSQNYIFTSNAKNLLGSIQETGIFSILPDGTLVNDSYSYKRSVFGVKKKEELALDHDKGIAQFESSKKNQQVKLDKNYHSRISYQIQLQRDLLNQCKEFSYPVIARGKIKQYRFEAVGEETLQTPLGELEALKIARIRENDERETLLWFAKDLNYALVKLYQREEDGEEYQTMLESGIINGIPLKQLLANSTPTTQNPEGHP